MISKQNVEATIKRIRLEIAIYFPRNVVLDYILLKEKTPLQHLSPNCENRTKGLHW